MFAASAEHSCICPLVCSEIARTRGPVALCEFLFSSWTNSLELHRSNPPILAGSDMSCSFSLSAGRPLQEGLTCLMASSRGCKLSSV